MSRFLEPWRYFFAKATDASPEYGEGAGLMVLSSLALGYRVLDMGRGVLPNLFMMLVGDSSVARKSTSVNLAKLMVEAVVPDLPGPRDYTVEGLIRWMNHEKDSITGKSKNKVVLFAEEFGGDLARMEAYGTTTAADFCALYDGNTFDKVRAKAGTLRIENPRVNLFAASAYQMLATYVKTRDWLSGYMMRFIYIEPVTVRPRFPLPPPWPDAEFDTALAAATTLRDDLTRPRGNAPTGYMRLKFTPAAEAMMTRWTQAMEAFTLGQQSANGISHTYTGRFCVNVQKIALLYQLDIDPFAPVDVAAVDNAIRFAGSVLWPSFQQVYVKTTSDDFAAAFQTVLDFLRASPAPVLKRELDERFHSLTFRKVLDHLIWSGRAKALMSPEGERIVAVR